MAERNVDSLAALFHEEAVFVHMGGTMTKDQELGVIRSGAIQYRNAEVQASSVRVIDSTAVVLNTIRLVAVVGGNEVVNPFEVTEVCTCGRTARGDWPCFRSPGYSDRRGT